MIAKRLGKLVADAVKRIERRHRLLKDHGDLCAADIVQLLFGHADQILTAIERLAGCLAVLGQKAHHCHGGLTFTGAGLADNGDGFTSFDIKIDAAHCLYRTVMRVECDLQVAHAQNVFTRHLSDPSGQGCRAGHRQGSSAQTG